jgi:YD repeat-containing protein
MRFRLIVCSGIVLMFSAAAKAQVTVTLPTLTMVGAGWSTDNYSAFFASACSLSGTTTNANPLVATISLFSFANYPGGNTPIFEITGVSAGTDQFEIIISSFGSNPACVFTAPYTITLNVQVGTPAAPLTSGETLNAGDFVEPVSTATGEMFGHDETADLNLGGPVGLEFRRYYASYLGSNKVPSALGTNWMHNFDVSLAVSGTSAAVTLFRGKTVTFSQSNNVWTLSSNEQRPYQLAAVTGGGYQFLDPTSNLIYSFGSTGALTSFQDRNGNTITVTQGANGPTLVSDGLGRTLTFTYTGTNLTKVQDQSGRTVSFQYSSGILTAFTDANGNQATFAYTSSGGVNGLMTAETRPAGNKPYTQTFDSTGRVSTQSDSFSNTMTLAYAGGGATLTETGGDVLTDANDGNMNLTSTSDPTGGVSKYAYDSNNRPASTIDRLGNQSKATWNAASGRPATYTDELGNTTSFTYSASTVGSFTFYDLAGVTFADGTTIGFTRDSKGNIISSMDQAGNIRQSTYTSNGWLATTTNPSGGVYTFSYNNDGTRSSLELPSSDITKFAYDSVKRLNLVTNPDGTTENFQYDAVSNPLKSTDERNNSVSASFDANNNVKTGTDALAATTNFTFDTDDRLAATTDPLGKAVTAAYDTQSRLKSLTNAAGNSVAYTYDNLNRVTASRRRLRERLYLRSRRRKPPDIDHRRPLPDRRAHAL